METLSPSPTYTNSFAASQNYLLLVHLECLSRRYFAFHLASSLVLS